MTNGNACFAYFNKSWGIPERIKGYRLSAADFGTALDIAKREGGMFAQFPWLLPNLIEAVVFEGKFQEAKRLSRILFEELGTNTQVRPPADARDLRIIVAFLNAVAEILDSGSADKEVYLLENAKLGRSLDHSPWDFSEMQTFLAEDYTKIRPELDATVREGRIALVRQWVGQLTGK